MSFSNATELFKIIEGFENTFMQKDFNLGKNNLYNDIAKNVIKKNFKIFEGKDNFKGLFDKGNFNNPFLNLSIEIDLKDSAFYLSEKTILYNKEFYNEVECEFFLNIRNDIFKYIELNPQYNPSKVDIKNYFCSHSIILFLKLKFLNYIKFYQILFKDATSNEICKNHEQSLNVLNSMKDTIKNHLSIIEPALFEANDSLSLKNSVKSINLFMKTNILKFSHKIRKNYLKYIDNFDLFSKYYDNYIIPEEDIVNFILKDCIILKPNELNSLKREGLRLNSFIPKIYDFNKEKIENNLKNSNLQEEYDSLQKFIIDQDLKIYLDFIVKIFSCSKINSIFSNINLVKFYPFLQILCNLINLPKSVANTLIIENAFENNNIKVVLKCLKEVKIFFKSESNDLNIKYRIQCAYSLRSILLNNIEKDFTKKINENFLNMSKNNNYFNIKVFLSIIEFDIKILSTFI